MVETNGTDAGARKTKCFKFHWSIYAVLLAFCIKKQKIIRNTTRQDKTKTTFDVLLHKTDDIKFLIITNSNLTIGLVDSYSSVNDCFLTT